MISKINPKIAGYILKKYIIQGNINVEVCSFWLSKEGLMKRYFESFLAKFLSLLLIVSLVNPNMVVLRGETNNPLVLNGGTSKFTLFTYNDDNAYRKVKFDFTNSDLGLYLFTKEDFDKAASNKSFDDSGCYQENGYYIVGGDDEKNYSNAGISFKIEKMCESSSLFQATKEAFHLTPSDWGVTNKNVSCLWVIHYDRISHSGKAVPMLILGDVTLEETDEGIKVKCNDEKNEVNIYLFKEVLSSSGGKEKITVTKDKSTQNISSQYINDGMEILFNVEFAGGMQINLNEKVNMCVDAEFRNRKEGAENKWLYVGKDNGENDAVLHLKFSATKEILQQVINGVTGKNLVSAITPMPEPTEEGAEITEDPSEAPTEDAKNPSVEPTEDVEPTSVEPTEDVELPSVEPLEDAETPSVEPSEDAETPTEDAEIPSIEPSEDAETPSVKPSEEPGDAATQLIKSVKMILKSTSKSPIYAELKAGESERLEGEFNTVTTELDVFYIIPEAEYTVYTMENDKKNLQDLTLEIVGVDSEENLVEEPIFAYDKIIVDTTSPKIEVVDGAWVWDEMILDHDSNQQKTEVYSATIKVVDKNWVKPQNLYYIRQQKKSEFDKDTLVVSADRTGSTDNTNSVNIEEVTVKKPEEGTFYYKVTIGDHEGTIEGCKVKFILKDYIGNSTESSETIINDPNPHVCIGVDDNILSKINVDKIYLNEPDDRKSYYKTEIDDENKSIVEEEISRSEDGPYYTLAYGSKHAVYPIIYCDEINTVTSTCLVEKQVPVVVDEKVVRTEWEVVKNAFNGFGKTTDLGKSGYQGYPDLGERKRNGYYFRFELEEPGIYNLT